MFKLKLFILLGALIAIIACSNETAHLELEAVEYFPDTDSNSESLSNGRNGTIPENTISLATFNAWNTNWETHWDDQYISYFTMPLSNLQNIVATPEVEAARFYFGYSDTDGYAHLTLVGVDVEDESMIGVNDYIYNVTKPCPTMCGDRPLSNPVVPPSGLTQAPTNTISLATFNTWNTSWKSRWDDSYIEYFTMPLSNLQNMVNTNGVAAVRLYLGYSEVDAQAHLTLVGVDDRGESMLGSNANIYDTSRPCPPFCKPSHK